MPRESTPTAPVAPPLRPAWVYGISAACLVLGLAAGYIVRGSQPVTAPSQASTQSTPARAMASGHMPTLEDMKRMADKQAAPLLEKLKNDPDNSSLLAQVGAIYHTTHQFKEAALYYNKAITIDPKNVALRTKLAASLYRDGNVDGAIAQLNQALIIDPTDANSLFNLGTIRLQGKRDAKGALAAWQKLLKSNPQLSPDRKAEVQKMMAWAATMLGDQHDVQGAPIHAR